MKKNEIAVYYTLIPDDYDKKHIDHMIGELVLDMAVKKEIGIPLQFMPRASTRYGKPFFTRNPELHYNISHSGRYVMCALCHSEVGIDVQKYTRVNIESLLRKVVPPKRKEEILSMEDKEKAFFEEWALREAYIKWTGEGLSMDMTRIPMERGWHKMLDVEEGYAAAIWTGQAHEIRMEYADVELP